MAAADYLKARAGIVLNASGNYGSGTGFFIRIPGELGPCLVTARHVAVASSVIGQITVGHLGTFAWTYAPKEVWIDRSSDVAVMRVFESVAPPQWFDEADLDPAPIAGAKSVAYGLPGFLRDEPYVEDRNLGNIGALVIEGDELPDEQAAKFVLPIPDATKATLRPLGGMSGAPLMSVFDNKLRGVVVQERLLGDVPQELHSVKSTEVIRLIGLLKGIATSHAQLNGLLVNIETTHPDLGHVIWAVNAAVEALPNAPSNGMTHRLAFLALTPISIRAQSPFRISAPAHAEVNPTNKKEFIETVRDELRLILKNSRFVFR